MRCDRAPKEVLHILGTAQPEGTSIAQIVRSLASGLDPTRYRLHAWFLSGHGPLMEDLGNAGIAVRSIDWPSGASDPAGAWRFWRAFEEQQFAIVHQHFGGRAPRYIAWWRSGAKIIVHLHCHFFEGRGAVPMAIRVQGADSVIAVSQAVADRVEGADARVVLAGVAVDGNDTKRGSPANQIRVGTAARLVPSKGIVHLIRAIALLHEEFPDVRLEIAGAGPERESLEREVTECKLGGNVQFLEWRTDLPALMRNWDIYVQPSLLDPFPIATIQATAAGLPVVATTAGGFPEIIEDGRTGLLVPPGDPVSLASRLRTLLVEPEQRRQMGAAGRARARARFSADRMTSDIAAIYDEILSSGPH
jgi:glycosyltransferase involved in cell wall biosynthesis